MNTKPCPVAAASPWRRIGAYLIDYFVFIVPAVGVLSLISWWLASVNLSLFSDNRWFNQLVVIGLLTIPVICYFALCEASRFQATTGKRLMRVIVVQNTGIRATRRQTATRAVVKFLPWEYFHTIMWRWDGWPTDPAPPTSLQILAMSFGWLVIGWFTITLFVGSGRTPYDWVAGTAVTDRSRRPQS